MNDNDENYEIERKNNDDLQMFNMPEMPKIIVDSVAREKSQDKNNCVDDSL